MLDFKACAEHLVVNNYAAAFEDIAVYGADLGGLLSASSVLQW